MLRWCNRRSVSLPVDKAGWPAEIAFRGRTWTRLFRTLSNAPHRRWRSHTGYTCQTAPVGTTGRIVVSHPLIEGLSTVLHFTPSTIVRYGNSWSASSWAAIRVRIASAAAWISAPAPGATAKLASAARSLRPQRAKRRSNAARRPALSSSASTWHKLRCHAKSRWITNFALSPNPPRDSAGEPLFSWPEERGLHSGGARWGVTYGGHGGDGCRRTG